MTLYCKRVRFKSYIYFIYTIVLFLNELAINKLLVDSDLLLKKNDIFTTIEIVLKQIDSFFSSDNDN
jgi:hypothetical protein